MTPRIPVAPEANLDPGAKTLLDQVGRALGMVPNLHKTLANAPAALRAYHDASRHLAGSTLSPQLKEQLAIATAGQNRCGYCASAHTLLGRGAGIADAELERNLRGEASTPSAAAALRFVKELLQHRGQVDDAALQRMRDAGFDDASILEVVAHVALNVFSNFVNNVAETVIDFPVVALPQEVAR
ncbi:MAG: carboxymuconolactone decarboxylase family protein [Planctomycetota bacterium]